VGGCIVNCELILESFCQGLLEVVGIAPVLPTLGEPSLTILKHKSREVVSEVVNDTQEGFSASGFGNFRLPERNAARPLSTCNYSMDDVVMELREMQKFHAQLVRLYAYIHACVHTRHDTCIHICIHA